MIKLKIDKIKPKPQMSISVVDASDNLSRKKPYKQNKVSRHLILNKIHAPNLVDFVC